MKIQKVRTAVPRFKLIAKYFLFAALIIIGLATVIGTGGPEGPGSGSVGGAGK